MHFSRLMHLAGQKAPSRPFFVVATVIFFVVIFLFAIHPIINYDTGYHLKTGQYIVEHHIIPKGDIFSFSAPGSAWITHYWLADVFFYIVYHYFGFLGSMWVVGISAVVTYWLVFQTVWLKEKTLLPFIVFFPLLLLTSAHWDIRPQIFSHILLAAVLYIIQRWRIQQSRRSLYCIPFLFLVWANLHAGVLLGLVILGLWVASSAVEARLDLRKVFLPAGILFASLVAALINPNGVHAVFLQSYVDTSVSADFFSILRYLYNAESDIFVAIMAVAILFFGSRYYWRWRCGGHVDLFNLGLVVFASSMPLVAIRHIAFYPLIIVPPLVWEISSLFREKQYAWESKKLFQRAVIMGGIALIILRIPLPIPSRINLAPGFYRGLFPLGAVDFIEREHIKGPFYNDVIDGGYLIWRLWPKEKVFIDGRLDVYSSGAALNDYISIKKGQPSLDLLINEKYKFNYFILPIHAVRPEDPELTLQLVKHLVTKLDFKLVYWDDVTILLLRNIPENKTVIDRFGYEVINPFRAPSALSAEEIKQAQLEIKEAIERNPDSFVLRAYGEKIDQAASSTFNVNHKF